MSRRIQEGYGAAVNFNSVCTDVLSYAACLSGGDICMTDIVKQ